MIKKAFKHWLFEEIEITFGIDRVKDLASMLDWLEVREVATSLLPQFEKLRISLSENVEMWNEDELKMMFIALFLAEFEFNNLPHYKVFAQRNFTLQTEEVLANGRVEWFIATGKQTHKKPYFFFQEYKPEKNSGNDPLGQLLIAMIYAQLMNKIPDKPIFGCYTIGRFWFFVLLEGKKYAVSSAFDATQIDDMGAMIEILEKVKKYIHQDLAIPYEKKF